MKEENQELPNDMITLFLKEQSKWDDLKLNVFNISKIKKLHYWSEGYGFRESADPWGIFKVSGSK